MTPAEIKARRVLALRLLYALRDFWQAVSTSPLGMPYLRHIEFSDDHHQLLNQAHAMNILLFGAPNFFVPRVPPIWPPCSPDKTSYTNPQ